MGLVRFAPRLPHTFYVLAVLIVFSRRDRHDVDANRHLSRDQHPSRDSYLVIHRTEHAGNGTARDDGEYSLSSSLNRILDIEAQTLNGVSIQKIFFQPNVNLDLAIAQIVAGTNSIRELMPAGHAANPDQALTPGIYCTVELQIPRKTPSLIVPSQAIIFNREGLSVAVVENGVDHIPKITEVRDLGTVIEVSEGVKDGDQAILNPPVDLTDGHKVTIRNTLPAQTS
jgi:hypothetical protein